MTQRTATDIAELLLDLTGRGLDTGDFELFLSAFALPYRHDTWDGTVDLTDADDMRVVYDQVRAYLEQAGATHVVRCCIAAEFKSPVKILSTHEAHIFAGTTRIRPPYPVMSELELRNGAWKIRSSTYAVSDDAAHKAALLPRKLKRNLSSA